jgi:hypothetical protein
MTVTKTGSGIGTWGKTARNIIRPGLSHRLEPDFPASEARAAGHLFATSCFYPATAEGRRNRSPFYRHRGA